MVETITPVVYGGRARWVVALALHVLGATVTAALFGAALGLAFTWAAASKLADLRAWRRTLSAHELPGGLEAAAVVGVPCAEALVPMFAAAGWTRAAGAWALVLLV